MATRIQFVYQMTLNMGFYRLQNENYFNKKRIIDMNVVDEVTCTRQSVTTRMVIRIL